MTKTYLFYDLETTGRNPAFDQVLQFAAIRTDLLLNELERHTIQVKLNCDFIPDPEATLIHRIPIEAMLHGETELTAIEKIHTLVNTPETISGGYNTLNFDDEFLRFSFHRNLLPPYTHQWANGCGRFDLYPLAQLYYLYQNDCLKWPVNAEGKISLKLELLSNLNALAQGEAHQAITDVEATVALARIFFRYQDKWSYGINFFNKEEELKRRTKINDFVEIANKKYQVALLLGNTGSTEFFQYPVLALGQHLHYKNQTLWLRLDKPELTSTTLDTIPKTTWTARQKPGETFLLPFSGRFKQHFNAERQKITEDNLHWLKNNSHLLHEIQTYYREYKYPTVHNIDVDADLYIKGFLTREEERLCAQFHAVPDEKKASIAERFQNPRLQEIGMRVIGRHAPQYLTPKLAERFELYLAELRKNSSENMPTDWRNEKRFTFMTALEKLMEIKKTEDLNAEKLLLLDGLKEYFSAQV